MGMQACSRLFRSSRRFISTSCRTNGYIVLVPEIGDALPEKNPLLRSDGLPEFNKITIENCIAAVGKQAIDFENNVRNIEDHLSTTTDTSESLLDHVLDQLEHAGMPLDTTWGLSKTLYLCNTSLMPTKSYLNIHNRAKKARATKFNSLPIYNLCQSYLEAQPKIDEEKSRLVSKYVLEGKLNGLGLGDSKKAILSNIVSKLTAERTKFENKVEVATKQFTHTFNDPNLARDIPEDLLKVMAVDRTQPLKGPWKLSLQPYVYDAFMEYCPDRELRWNAWNANVHRCSIHGDKALENSTVVEKIRDFRRDQAKLLGYETFADMSMETKMAGDVGGVRRVVATLRDAAVRLQEKEMQQLGDFARERGFDRTIEVWDVQYWRRKQRRALFTLTDDEVKEYFPLPKVLSGLFGLCETVFGVKIVERSGVSVWHEDVRYYDVFESHTSAPVAGFFLDPYAREDGKISMQKNLSWMVGVQNHSRVAETKALSALIFNFQPPKFGVPCLLGFSDVVLLFSKFGHAMQHLLTKSSHSDIAGLSNLEWDVVDVSGDVLSNWVYEKSLVGDFSCHYKTGEPIPSQFLENLGLIRNHMAGLSLCQQLYFSELDLDLHSTTDFWLDVVKRLWPSYFAFPLDKYDSHVCSFKPIFSGQWAAAYYSNVWSKMIAADVYGAFQEAQGDEEKLREVGKRFRDTFLASGGACSPHQVFRKFRGRDPSPNALLISSGMK